jgi:hypothetical protein
MRRSGTGHERFGTASRRSSIEVHGGVRGTLREPLPRTDDDADQRLAPPLFRVQSCRGTE